MSIASRIQSKGMFATSIFYAVVGAIFISLLFIVGFAPHVGLLGVFSIITAYGLMRRRAWSYWLVVILFFSGTTFAVFMIYDVWTSEYIVLAGMIAYAILTWVFTAYATMKRRILET